MLLKKPSSDSLRDPPVSLRLGHVRVLTTHRVVIHYAHAASLPRGEGKGVIHICTVADNPEPPLCKGRWHAAGVTEGLSQCSQNTLFSLLFTASADRFWRRSDTNEMSEKNRIFSKNPAVFQKNGGYFHYASPVGANSCRLRRSARAIGKEGVMSDSRGRLSLHWDIVFRRGE